MSFIRDYLIYADGDEVPKMFHLWGAYVCLSAAIGRKVWKAWGDNAIYPNLYVMYVGDAGNGKSWAMGKVKRVLTAVPGMTEQFSSSIETPQALIRRMVGDDSKTPPVQGLGKFPVKWPDGVTRDSHHAIIMASEFINYISLQDKEWVNVLNDIYDTDNYHYHTLAQGAMINVTGPYITMLGALTTEVSNDLQKQRIVATGFARRTLFQYGERQWHAPVSEPTFTPEQAKAKARAIERLRELRQLGGEFQWADESVAKWWTKWYEDHTRSVPKKSPQVKSWFSSKPVQVLKLAMLTSLADSSDLKIREIDLQIAIEQLGNLELDLHKVFGGAGRNELASIGVKITEYLTTLNEVIFWKTLYGQTFPMFDKRDPMKDFEATLTWLKDQNQIAECSGMVANFTTPVRLIGTPAVIARFVAENGPKQPPPPAAGPTA